MLRYITTGLVLAAALVVQFSYAGVNTAPAQRLPAVTTYQAEEFPEFYRLTRLEDGVAKEAVEYVKANFPDVVLTPAADGVPATISYGFDRVKVGMADVRAGWDAKHAPAQAATATPTPAPIALEIDEWAKRKR